MTASTIGLIGIGGLTLLILLRMPIAFAMALVGFVGFWSVSGIKGALGVLGQSPYHTLAHYEYTVVALFILMGEFAFHSGISRGLYNFADKLLGRFPGGLAMASIGGCALFAAISGSSMSTAATIATMALPEMERYKYDPALATGCLAAGGTLGVLIPPSIGFIIYGLITEQSIGKLFIAGILPGILLTGLFILTIYLLTLDNPHLAPPTPKAGFKEVLAAAKDIWAMVVLFLLCIGGIYSGLVAPVEAGGVGAFGAFIIGLAKRTLSWQGILNAIVATGKLTAMIFTILFCANIFGYFISSSALPLTLANAFAQSALPPYVILAGILLMYLIIGCFMEFLSMMILTLPIIFPVVKALGFDPIWFGVIMVVMLEMAQITPPVGINVYTIKGVAKDVPISTIFRGIMPFWGAQAICLLLLIIFPQISLYLPQKMYQ